MERYLAAVILFLTTSLVQAQHYHGHHARPAMPHYHHHSNGSWIAPLVIGGVVGYALSRPAVVQTVPVPVYPTVPLGTPAAVLPPAPWGYHYEQILDSGCNCYRWVLSPN